MARGLAMVAFLRCLEDGAAAAAAEGRPLDEFARPAMRLGWRLRPLWRARLATFSVKEQPPKEAPPQVPALILLAKREKN